MQSLGVDGAANSISNRRRNRCCPTSGHPYAAGESVYDITFENVQAGLRTDYLFRLANHHGRHRHRHRRSVRTRAGLVHLWRRRSDGALQRQCRRAEDADPASDPLDHRHETFRRRRAGRRWMRSLRRRFPPNWCRSRRARSRKARRPRSARTRCRISPCSTSCATASRRRRSPSWRCTPGKIRRAATGRRISMRTGGVGYDLKQIRHWMAVFLTRFFAFSQFKRSAMPNGPKVSAGGSLSPRGDWRAPSDGNAAAWLAELERNVPVE